MRFLKNDIVLKVRYVMKRDGQLYSHITNLHGPITELSGSMKVLTLVLNLYSVFMFFRHAL